MRYLALDYGDYTVGVAISDLLNSMSHPLETIVRERKNKLRRTLSRIEEIVVENDITHIIIGYPLMISGDQGNRCEETKIFKELLDKKLSNKKVKIIFVDERYTTAEANDILLEMGVKYQDRKKYIDKIAASIILQSYLNEGKMNDKLIFKSDEDELEMEILEQTTLGGNTYILAENNDEAYILKKINEKEEDIIYEVVKDDEAESIAKVFSEMLDLKIE